MTKESLIILLIGTAAMWLLVFLLMIRYREKVWKSVPVALSITIVGTIGAFVWPFIENSAFEGRSYYGAVFVIPLVFLYLAKWLRIPYGDLMDFCAPAGCVMLMIMKLDCLRVGCCPGITMYYTFVGDPVLFPSQLVESINGAVLMVILFVMAWIGKQRQKMYGWFMLLYGSTRFILNFFRDDSSELIAGLPNGTVWSLVAIFIGFLWITNRKLAIIKRNTEEDGTKPAA